MWNELLQHYMSYHCLVDAREHIQKNIGASTSGPRPSQNKESMHKDSGSLHDRWTRRKTDGNSATGHMTQEGTEYSTGVEHSSNSYDAINTNEEKRGGPLQPEEDEDGFIQVRASKYRRRKDRLLALDGSDVRDQECHHYMGTTGHSLSNNYIRGILRQKGITVRSVEILNSRRDSPGKAAKITVGKDQERKLLSVSLPAGVYIRKWYQRSDMSAPMSRRAPR